MTTTAQQIKLELLKQGIVEEDIRDQHILSLYTHLNKVPSMPQYDLIDNIFLENLTQKIENNSSVLGVIVETRKHQALEKVVNKFAQKLNIPIQIFCGKDNYDFILSTTISKLIQNKKVYITQLNVSELNANKYNALLLSESFWKHLFGRDKILIFQTDAFLCDSSVYGLNDFMKYDYIGSKWPIIRPVGLIIDGGNGGLSLRDWSQTYECLNRFNPKYWTAGEDGYFAFHIELMGGKIGRGIECAQFSTQNEFLSQSFGCHQITNLSSESREAFLSYSPEASFLDIILQ